jgi:hypothetical protein
MKYCNIMLLCVNKNGDEIIQAIERKITIFEGM